MGGAPPRYWLMRIPEWLSVSSNTVFCIFAAWLVETVIGRPSFVPGAARLLGYPARFFGRLFSAVAERLSAKKPDKAEPYAGAAGGVMCAYVVMLVFAVSAVLLNMASDMGVAPHSALSILCLYSALSARSLADGAWRERDRLRRRAGAAARAGAASGAGGPPAAGQAAGAGPKAGGGAGMGANGGMGAGANADAHADADADADAAGGPGAEREIRLAIERVARDAVQAFAAPLTYMAVGAIVGMPAPFALAYAAICALHGACGAAAGQPDGAPGRFGRAAAALRHAADYVPARLLCAVLPIAALASGRGAGGFRRCAAIARRDGGNSFDPNSALILAAYAGALNLRLGGGLDGADGRDGSDGGDGRGGGFGRGSAGRGMGGTFSRESAARATGGDYPETAEAPEFAVGDDNRRPEAADIACAARMTVAASACVFGLYLAAMLLLLY